MTLQTIEKRREEILSIAYEQGHVYVKDLAQSLVVSEATVRRDLHGLSREGLLELTHGGAKVIKNSDHSFISKSMRNVEAKRTIAKMAANLITDGGQIFLDSGTTCFQMTSFLRTRRSLSVIVHSIRIAQELQTPGTKILIPGGQYRPERMDTIGPMALESLGRLHGYDAFIGADGLSVDFGLTSVDIESAQLLTLAVKNARQTYLLTDASKFDNPALYKIVDLEAITTVITDRKPSYEWLSCFEKKNINIIYPGKTALIGAK